MPENCYFRAKGTTQGYMDGTCNEKGFEKMTFCHLVEFGVSSPYDQATGQASGKRTYKPLRIIAKLEESCVQWLQCVVSNEEIIEAIIKFPVKDVSQGKITYLSIKVTSGRFISCRMLCPDTQDPANIHRTHLCEAELVARKWEVTHFGYKEAGNIEHRTGVTATDAWDNVS